MKIGLDTNVLAYAEGVNDAHRRDMAFDILQQIPRADVVIAAQVLGELWSVLVYKAGVPRESARQAILTWSDAFVVADTSFTALQSALDLAADHRLSIWDALVMSVSADAGCRLLLSGDLQDGFTWAGLTMVNPFAETVNPLLAAATAEL